MKQNYRNAVKLEAWNPQKERLEYVKVRSQKPYRITTEDGKEKIVIFDLSEKMQRIIRRTFDNNVEVLPVVYEWDFAHQTFIADTNVIVVEDLKTINPMRYTFFVHTPLEKGMLKEIVHAGGTSLVDIVNPIRVKIQRRGIPHYYIYGEFLDFKKPKFFGLFGNYIEMNVYNINNDPEEEHYVTKVKIKMKLIQEIVNCKYKLLRGQIEQ